MPLQKMKVVPEEIQEGVAVCICIAPDELTAMRIALNFPEERFQIDPINNLDCGDDGTAAAMLNAAEIMRFKADYFANGSLEVKHSATGEMLGRCDAFIPMNIDLGRTIENMRRRRNAFLSMAEQRNKEQQGTARPDAGEHGGA